MKLRKIQLIPVLVLAVLIAGCNKGATDTSSTGGTITPAPPPPTVTIPASFAKGADISWLTQMELTGIKFYNSSGAQEDCMKILKDLGVNSIRLRVWVNPSDGWCNTSDVLAKAVRAKNMGMRILLDFHYSDSWADPGKQTKPAVWVGQDLSTLHYIQCSEFSVSYHAVTHKIHTPAFINQALLCQWLFYSSREPSFSSALPV